ncbi:peptidoglycan-binding protein [Actinosynnema sp. NPDC091369]
MRRPMKRFLAVTMAAILAIGLCTTSAMAESRVTRAEIHCSSFSNVIMPHIGQQYFQHVPSTAWDSYNFGCVLARGDRNVGVLALQESLNKCFARAIDQDAIFGTETENAVRYAQGEINRLYGRPVVAVDGRFGPQTSFYFIYSLYDHWNAGFQTDMCKYRGA